MGKEDITATGSLIDIQDKEKVTVLTMLVQGKEVNVSAFKSLPLPALKLNADYEFTYHEFNGFLNISCNWEGRKPSSYKIKLVKELPLDTSAKGGATSPPPVSPTAFEKDARITRLSCASSAANIVSALIAAKKITKPSEALSTTLLYAQALEAFAYGKKLEADDIGTPV